MDDMSNLDLAAIHARLRDLTPDKQIDAIMASNLTRDRVYELDDLAASLRGGSEHAEGSDGLSLEECPTCGDLDATNGVDYYWHPAAAASRLPVGGTDEQGNEFILVCPACGSFDVEHAPNTDPDPRSLTTVCRACGRDSQDDEFRSAPGPF